MKQPRVCTRVAKALAPIWSRLPLPAIRAQGVRPLPAKLGLAISISASEFDAFVEMLRQEIDHAGIGSGPKNEPLRLLAPMKQAIVVNY